ncbi:uncharacterized protein LOC141628442 [Silene latifolia]|uniref:uncharacterized protein LOC141628442 n=1 Tax=Silene latifolia TaxID=37657 RepID=UPI003D784FAD
MSFLSLNCRGLGNPAAVGGLCNLLRKEAPSFVFLSETKLRSTELHKIRRRLVDYEGYAVDCVGKSGGLALLWKKSYVCSVISATVHYIDVEVGEGEEQWRVTGFYGWPAVQDRHLSWQQLRILASTSLLPWMCLGDFNEILYSTEMKGGSRMQWQMNNIRDAVDECGLRDLPYEGYAFTFDNGQAGDANRQCRLDRAMVNGG